ncbi:MAG: hypothetical protein ABIJ09_25880 [Pseudomonadota bacterium]
MRALALARGGVALALSMAWGCNNGFDSPDELHDLRILAVRTEPAELKLPVRYLFAPPDQRPPDWTLPGWPVDVQVYAFDPRGGALTTSSFLCPEFDADPSCLEFSSADFISADLPAAQQAELRAVYQAQTRANTLADPARDPAVPVGDNRFHFDFTPAVIDSLLWREGADPWGLFLQPLLPRVVVQTRNDAVDSLASERAFKRFPISLDFNDPELPPPLMDLIANIFGAPPCAAPPADDDPFVEGPAPCFFDRGPNHNPVLTGFDLVDPYAEAVARAAGEPVPVIRFSERPQLGPHPVLLVEPGGTLHLRPVFLPDSMERYQVFVLAPFAQEFALHNRYEDFVCFWYVTGGALGGGDGQGNITSSTSRAGGVDRESTVGFEAVRTPLDMDWVVAGTPEHPLGEGTTRDTLVLVVEDQRGGVAVGQVIVEYRR